MTGPPVAPPTPSEPSSDPAWRRWLDKALRQLKRLWADSPEWYRAAALAIVALFAVMVGLLALLTLAGVTQQAATAWGALFVAGTTLATFFVGRLAQELERRDQRTEARIDLAVALYAEITSNIERQRRVVTDESIEKKLVAEFGAAAPRPPGASAAGKPGTTADDSDPIFARAVENYERIPQSCIFDVVRYYNLNGMLNTATASVSQRALAPMQAGQKERTLVEFYRLAREVDDAGVAAADALKAFIGEKGATLWTNDTPRAAELPAPKNRPFSISPDDLPARIAIIMAEAAQVETDRGKEVDLLAGTQPVTARSAGTAGSGDVTRLEGWDPS